jgi:nucleotide-binding universal stress UspA family protein
MMAAISGTPVRPVVTAIDGTNLTERSAQVGARLAHTRGATLILARAIPGTARHGMLSYLLEDRADEVENVRTTLRHLADALRDAFPGLRVEVTIADGAPAPALVEAMRRADLGLAVVATRGRPMIARTFGGSVAGEITRNLNAPTLVLWPQVIDSLTTEEWRDDTLIIPTTAPLGRRVLLPMAEAIRHPRLVAEAFRLARDAAGEVLILAGPDGATREAATRLASVAGGVGLGARVESAPTSDWVGIANAVSQERCDVAVLPTVAAVPGTRPGLGSIHRNVVTRAHVPVLCVPDLPNGERHGLASLYPDLPLPLLDAARHLAPR